MKKKTFIYFLIFTIVLASFYVNNSNSFAAQKGSVKGLSVTLKKSSFPYTGKAKKPTVTVKYNGKKLSPANYTIKYAAGRKAIGKYSIKVIGKGKYKGTKTVYFTIIPKKPTIYKTTIKNNNVSIIWKSTNGGVSAYQLMIAKDDIFKRGKKVYTVNSVKKDLTLSYSTDYYVKVRGVKTVKGKKYYSEWSDTRLFIIGMKPQDDEYKKPYPSVDDNTSTSSETQTSSESNTAEPITECEHIWVEDVAAHYEWQDVYDENGTIIDHYFCRTCGCDIDLLWEELKKTHPDWSWADAKNNHLNNNPTHAINPNSLYENIIDENGNVVPHPLRGRGYSINTYMPATYKCSKCGKTLTYHNSNSDFSKHDRYNIYLLQKYGKDIDISLLEWCGESGSYDKKTVKINDKILTYYPAWITND